MTTRQSSLLALHQNVLMVSLIAPDGTVRWPERGA
jgi:hypothetical protein